MHFFPLVGNPGVQKWSGYLGTWDHETPQSSQSSPETAKEAGRCSSGENTALQNASSSQCRIQSREQTKFV